MFTVKDEVIFSHNCCVNIKCLIHYGLQTKLSLLVMLSFTLHFKSKVKMFSSPRF